jgi:hypothetical protein
MEIQVMKRSFGQLLIAAVLIVCTEAASAQANQEIAVPLTDPSRPVTLEVSAVSAGSLAIIGYDGDAVLIAPVEESQRFEPADRRATGGLRRIPNTSMGLSVEERDNAVTVQMNSREEGAGLRVSVPRRTSVKLTAVNAGNVTVVGVSGEHEISSTNGSITATDLSGSAIVNTTNGDITVSLLELIPDTAMSFTTFNGDVDVSLPANLEANLHMTTNRGDIFTDFEVEMQPQTATVERSDDGSRFRVELEREVRATVGGGGPEMRFKTFHGDIVIHAR